MYVIPEQVDTD